MSYSPILVPVVALVAWTLIVMLWMFVTRLGEFRRLGVTLGSIPAGSRGVDMEGKADPSAQWKSHNYNHLMEQPTLFYATVFTLFLSGAATPLIVMFAWAYVILRVIHSVYQATINKVPVRFAIFLLSTLCLLFLAVHAVLATI